MHAVANSCAYTTAQLMVGTINIGVAQGLACRANVMVARQGLNLRGQQ